MGSQQNFMLSLGILLIVISIAVWFGLFRHKMTNNNRNLIISDVNIYAGVAMTYYKTPVDMGGGNRTWDVDNLGIWLSYNYDATSNNISNDNGIFVFSSIGDVLTITATGNEIGINDSANVQVELDLIGETNEITTTVIN